MKNILKYYLMIVGFLTTLFMVLFVIFLFTLISNIGKMSVSLGERETLLADQPYYLELNLVGEIQDQEVSELDLFIQLIEERPRYQLYELIMTLDQASRDGRIKGLVIKNLDVKAPLSSLFELSEALVRFRTQGKKVYVFLNEADNQNYLLASAADKIFLQKEGSLFLPGISGSFIYVKDTLAKIGVEADFLRAGRYKSAPETFTDNKMSEDSRKVYTELLTDIQDTFITTLVKNRNLSREEVAGCLNKALFTAKEALQRKLVDVLSYQDEFLETVEKKLFPRIEPLEFTTYTKVSPTSIKGLKVDTHRKIAIIVANGLIQMSAEENQIKEPSILPSQIIKGLEEVEEDPTIKALILRVNSQGGSALASDIIWNRIRKLNAKKPVFVSMGPVAASGGYYISMAAGQLYAGRTTLTGSIGVFGGKFVVSDLLNKIGAHTETISFSEGASLFSPIQSFTPNQRQEFDRFLQHTYRSFVAKAALSRNKKYEELNEIAQGRVWTGQQARQVGLVDGIGGYHEVIEAVKKKIGLEKGTIPTIVPIRIEAENLLDMLRTIFPLIVERLGLSSSSLESCLSSREAGDLKRLKGLISQEKSLYLMPILAKIE
ncbi:MAG: signal peptide peptidase SppA [bacterium]|nr:signal peptide peptidase SppA [bacterium]